MTVLCKKLLIANRGEIACRIAATARRLGVRTVAVYTEVDFGALHTRAADEAVHIPSYLDADAILAAAAQTGADALHPGCGFLSESAAFAAQCRAAGVVFVGPPAEAMAAAASKSAARQLAAKANIATVPGFDDPHADDAALHKAAEKIGTPLLIKAVAGGGGRGLRVVREMPAFAAALASARREAKSGFGDGALLLEKYVPRARHIEVQLLADAHGAVRTLGLRDCSLQRRHQKVVEEAPAPNLPEGVEDAITRAAAALFAEMNYASAGTAEFLLDIAAGAWYFLEVNARLQVEHPVTEMIYGVDLVEWQLRIAAGEALPATAWQPQGAAMEARLCAEQPLRDYLPASGRLYPLRLPAGAGVRVECGVQEGDAVAQEYDSLLMKVIAHGGTREEARQRLAQALEDTQIGGESNSAQVHYLLHTPAFCRAEMYTAQIADEEAQWRAALEAQRAQLLALAALPALFASAQHGELAGFRLNAAAATRLSCSIGGRTCRATVQRTGAADAEVTLQMEGEDAQLIKMERIHIRRHAEEWHIQAAVDGMQRQACLVHAGAAGHIRSGAASLTLQPLAVDTATGAAAKDATAPMNAVVNAVNVQVGQAVEKDAPLLMLEAMKMEIHLTAPHAGVVTHIHCQPGDRVSAGAVLVEISPQEREAED